jgi:hypothetical protein
LDPAILSAMSAILGSAVGGSASIVTAWLTQRTQGRREHIETEIRKREQLYVEFITEGSKLLLESLDHDLNSPQQLSPLYSVLNRIRLRCSDEVLTAAESTTTFIVEQYLRPSLSPEDVRHTLTARGEDPLRAFSEACRHELGMLDRLAASNLRGG